MFRKQCKKSLKRQPLELILTIEKLQICDVNLIFQGFQLLHEFVRVSNNVFVENKQVTLCVDVLMEGRAHLLDEIFVVFVISMEPRKDTIILPFEEKGQEPPMSLD